MKPWRLNLAIITEYLSNYSFERRSTEWTVWGGNLGVNPLEEARVVEDVSTRRLLDCGRILEVVNADATARLHLLA